MRADGLTPKRPAPFGPLELPPDGAEVSELSRTVAAALGSDDQKVETLRRDVAAGAYVVDPIKLARKMLQIDTPE
ncbi:MAG: flagellar biosynthesis anti-sigma factor FlgM [Bryobacteraceae bacterium]